MKRKIIKKTKGFSLIELLVVLAIIVILAALIIVNINQARMSGRDSKRIADVASIELALGLYNNANKDYPAFSGWAAATEVVGSPEQANWIALSGYLEPYQNPIPKDPLNKTGGNRYYIAMNVDSSNPADIHGIGAIIKTKLEVNPEKMEEDSCSTNTNYYDVIIGYFPDGEDESGVNYCTQSPIE